LSTTLIFSIIGVIFLVAPSGVFISSTFSITVVGFSSSPCKGVTSLASTLPKGSFLLLPGATFFIGSNLLKLDVGVILFSITLASLDVALPIGTFLIGVTLGVVTTG
jgi:hypothetical protein